MTPISSHSRARSAVLLLAAVMLTSLSCNTVGSLFATPTFTPSPTATLTPTITPSPTLEFRLSQAERGDYLVILRYTSEAVKDRFGPIMSFLNQQGFSAKIDEGPSSVGDMDVILYGATSCNDAIDDLTLLLHDTLAIRDLDRIRFDSNDLSYTKKNIVIQIKDIDRFDPGL
jgi:hypothetical protein